VEEMAGWMVGSYWSALLAASWTRSYDFNKGVDYAEIMKAYVTMGYQGTNLGEAIEEIKRMVRPGPGLQLRRRRTRSEY
jgi:hypothetical protein